MHLSTAQSESILHETQKNRTSSIIFRTNNTESFHSFVNFMRDLLVPLVMCGIVVVLKLCSIPSTAGVPSGLSSGHCTGCHTLGDTFIAAHWARVYSPLMCDVMLASIQSTRPLTSLFSPHANGCI